MALPARRLAADLDEFVLRATGLLGAVEHFRSEAEVERATRALIEADAAIRADANEVGVQMRLHAQLTAVRAEIASLDAALNRFASDLGHFDTRLQTARVAAARALRAPACDDDTEFASVDDLDDDATDVSGDDENGAAAGGSREQASRSGPRPHPRSRIPAHRASDILLLAARFARVSASPAEMLEFKWAPSGQMPHPVAEEQMRASRLHGANSLILDSLKHGGSAAATAIGDAAVSDAEQIRRLRAGWRKGDPVPPELLRLLAKQSTKKPAASQFARPSAPAPSTMHAAPRPSGGIAPVVLASAPASQPTVAGFALSSALPASAPGPAPEPVPTPAPAAGVPAGVPAAAATASSASLPTPLPNAATAPRQPPRVAAANIFTSKKR